VGGAVGASVGEAVGASVGEAVGASVGVAVFASLGEVGTGVVSCVSWAARCTSRAARWPAGNKDRASALCVEGQ
jgi:hypothetical protein